MLTAIFSVTAIICYIAIVVTYKPQVKYNNGMLFAITLPAHAMDHEEVQRIRTRFNQQFKKTSLSMVISFVPFLLLHDLMSYQFIYFFVWITVFFFVMVIPFRRAFRDTLALKREHDWFVGTKRVILSDLRVARLKNQHSASLWLFIIPFAMAVGTMLWAIASDIQFIALAFVGLILTTIFLLISLFMRGSKGKVYSENSEVNVALNQARGRSISYLWLSMAIVENIHMMLVYLLILNDNAEMNGVWVTILLLFTVIPIGLIYYTYHHICTLEQEVLAQDGKIIYTDDDEYWANGFTYHNPNDSSILVPKRVGIGETINTGTVVGKFSIWTTIGLSALLIIGVSFMLIRSELTSPVLTVTADHTIEIDYPMYSFDFNIADIEEIMLVNEVPSGLKSNGESTTQHARGHFKLKEIGKARLYIFKKNPPYIRIKLDDVYIFYNEQDPELTKTLFEQLQKL